jgi:hypothetical protein
MTGDVPAEHVAQVLAGLLPGFVLQHALFGDVAAAAFRAGLRALLTGSQADPSTPSAPLPAASA